MVHCELDRVAITEALKEKEKRVIAMSPYRNIWHLWTWNRSQVNSLPISDTLFLKKALTLTNFTISFFIYLHTWDKRMLHLRWSLDCVEVYVLEEDLYQYIPGKQHIRFFYYYFNSEMKYTFNHSSGYFPILLAMYCQTTYNDVSTWLVK
jgi:hypothetical protein